MHAVAHSSLDNKPSKLSLEILDSLLKWNNIVDVTAEVEAFGKTLVC